MYTPEMIEMMKKQWAAAGIDPEMMMQQINQAMQMSQSTDFQVNMQAKVEEQLNNNPMIQQLTNLMGGNNTQVPEGFDDLLNMNDDTPPVKEEHGLTDTELQAVLCTANIAMASSYYTNTLSTYQPVDQLMGGLEYAWSITDKEELLDTIEFMKNTGHRAYFNPIWEKLSSLPKAEWRAGISSLSLNAAIGNDELDPERFNEFAIGLLECYPLLVRERIFSENPNILAWDIERAINLCRFGYDVEFLKRDEALEIMQDLAKMLQESFDSWEEMSKSYLVGFGMWCGENDRLEGRIEQHKTMCTHEQSPWLKTAFK